jgi:NADPH-dependent curcumin reductase CurA
MRRNLVMHDAGDRNHRILFSLRPEGTPVPESFGADTTAVPTPGPGQFLSRTLYLSLDPLYRSAMRSNADASLRLNPGDVMSG